MTFVHRRKVAGGSLLGMRSRAGFWLRCILLVLLVGGRLGLSEAQAQDEPAAVVEMTNTLEFTPDTVRVEIGDVVEWRNTSLLAHTVTADPKQATLTESAQLPVGAEPFDSGMLNADEVFRHRFEVAGTYGYFCIPHEGAKMRGIVIVQSREK